MLNKAEKNILAMLTAIIAHMPRVKYGAKFAP